MRNIEAQSLNLGSFPALAGISALPLFWLLSNVAATLHPGYNILRQTVSELALGPYGWIQTADFFVVGVLVIVFSSGLYYGVQRRCGFRAGIGILVFVGLGTFLLGFFPTEPGVTPTLVTLSPHLVITGAVFSLFPLAFLLLAPSLKADPFWSSLFVYTVVAGALGLGLFVGIARLPSDWEFFGIYERMLLANGLIWMEIIGIRLLRFHQKCGGKTNCR